MSGTQAWFDQYDPVTGKWTVLPDAPHARDHAQAAIVDDKLYMLAGRRSSQAINQGSDIAIELVLAVGTDVSIDNSAGQFWVSPADKPNLDFNSRGRLEIEKGYYKFKCSDQYWLKGVANTHILNFH